MEQPAFLLYVDERMIAPFETLQMAQDKAQTHIEAGHAVEVQTSSQPTEYWCYDEDEGAWLSAAQSRWSRVA